MNFKGISAALAALLLALTVAVPQGFAASREEIDIDVRAALARFREDVGGSGELLSRASAVLVFPSVVKAGFGFGGEYGEGALLRRDHTEGYYNTVSASFGFQLGVQAKTVIIVFMTEDALRSFKHKHGWKVGVDGSVALVTVGAGGAIDTNQITQPVVGFILDQKGLMYNLTLEGSKITRIAK